MMKMGDCTRKRKGKTAGVLMVTPCTKSIGNDDGKEGGGERGTKIKIAGNLVARREGGCHLHLLKTPHSSVSAPQASIPRESARTLVSWTTGAAFVFTRCKQGLAVNNDDNLRT